MSYDVRDPKRLRRAAKLVSGHGPRLQLSVYRCWLTPRELERLRWELTELLTAEDDVLMIPLYERCVDGMQCAHSAVKSPDWPEEPPGHRIV